MTHICPVEGTQLNEPTIRVVAFLVVIITVFGIVFHSPVVFFFLTYDFFVRGFYNRQWSLLRLAAIQIVNLFRFKTKLIDAGGKRFAAKIGFFISVTLTISELIQWPAVVCSFGGILVFFAILESVFSYCFGCQMYTWFNIIVPELSGTKKNPSGSATK
jgi:hypothetical protein